ncbi:MAG: hypothetical protein F4X47_07290 [Gammaproteobacteria bacterium]|nr:hypothetical protein [Gammaproteobacteria bacterium]
MSTWIARLTKLGKTISETIGAKEWAKRLAEGEEVESIKGKSEYEVQELCKDYAFKLKLTISERNMVMKAACDNGINVVEVLDVLGLELRDVLLGIEERME